MKLSELVQILSETQVQVSGQTLETDILNVTADTKEVKPGSLFVAIRGTQKDGHDWIPEALKNGASFVVGEDLSKLTDFDANLSELRGKWICVSSARSCLQKLAQKFYGDPSSRLFCLGITGTNGKTSSTYMLEHVFNSSHLPMGVMGTINHHFKEQAWPTTVTTPDPVLLQKRLLEMEQSGARAVAMEVSSHALEQLRVDGVQFNTVLFTNLSRDHLDYHANMKDYFCAKQRLFTEILRNSKKPFHWAIVNADDPWGRRLRVEASAGVWTFGRGPADFKFEIKQVSFARTDFDIVTPYMKIRTSIPSCGLHNIYNAVGVIAASATAMIAPAKSAELLTSFQGVPGRMQMIANSKSLHVFVDYAHSPDALENVLRTLVEVRNQSGEKAEIWCVFGCGGDRDKGKRPMMAQVAAKYSDHVMITSDNPRTEDANSILNDIAQGFAVGQKYQREPDRKKAIETVLSQVRLHDVVIIAGKGHEDYQIVGNQKTHFSDAEVVKEILK